ncbi:molecular chaperone GrpE [Fervidicella metallireducens AeB]|uniref:Protein GrpE n=1 Tax=Fervidicella metallireducens AeB TaxID=1403537 RepID=A0A017RU52_9CLOT|nr:nucleotide exchange factor GrpE [Fervidicella metallireducens]EYE88111.1 molecular chaperone GrpE [Fervidicella metallireducens AeB]
MKENENTVHTSSEILEDEVQNNMDCNDNVDTEVEGKSEDVNEELKKIIEEKDKQCQEYLDMLKRTKAEFDNFRKRTAKEKESMYDDGFGDSIKEILPILDNLERAVSFNTEKNSFSDGVEMVLKMFKDTLAKLGVEEIKSEGEEFNPNYHNAVMHIEDENFDKNIVVEVFQKGYIYKDRVLRYSMVKVAN